MIVQSIRCEIRYDIAKEFWKNYAHSRYSCVLKKLYKNKYDNIINYITLIIIVIVAKHDNIIYITKKS